MTDFTAQYIAATEAEFFAAAAQIAPGKRIFTPNAKWKEPSNKEVFLAFFILSGEGQRVNLGKTNVWERMPVILQIDVVAPPETNEREYASMAEKLGRIFAHREIAIGFNHKVDYSGVDIKTGAPLSEGRQRVSVRVSGIRDYKVL